jgi:capsid protein
MATPNTPRARKSRIVDSAGKNMVAVTSGNGRTEYVTHPVWMGKRYWEAAETTRLNEAHWLYAESSDCSINDWIADKGTSVRARCTFESRQNGTIAGVVNTLADDVVGQDGPTLEVQSSNEAFNAAAERAWREWFRAPTFRPNVSGVQLLRLWVKNLPKCGEFIAQIGTKRNADGPVKMRLRPKHARDLASPVDRAGDPKVIMGVEFDNAELDQPIRYWFGRNADDGFNTIVEPWPADLVIHEFMLEEESQARGYAWMAPSIQPAADLRDYDDQVQDAARQMADQSGLLYTENADEPWMTPESSTVERRTIKMAPPGWKPFVYPATLPPVQYPDYRAERQREIGRPLSMPLMIMRLDASKHNYSSARFDGQGWARFVQFVQTFLSGSDKTYGTLNRLVDLVLAEARFAIPELRNVPPDVVYDWTWPVRPHVDPQKEGAATETRLNTFQSSLTEERAAQGKSIDSLISSLLKEKQKFEKAGLPLPPHLSGVKKPASETPPTADDDEGEDEEDTDEEADTEDEEEAVDG